MSDAQTKPRPIVIYIKESLWQSVCSDIVTFSTIIGIAGVGWYIGSSALEWIGAIMGLVVLVGRGSGTSTSARRHKMLLTGSIGTTG